MFRRFSNDEKTSFTKGEQIWDFLYSGDAGRAFRLLGVKGLSGKTYVIGSGEAKELREYIKIMAQACKYDDLSGLGEIDYSDNQVMYLKADISELTTDTGFKPLTDFDEGIRKTINYLKNIR